MHATTPSNIMNALLVINVKTVIMRSVKHALVIATLLTACWANAQSAETPTADTPTAEAPTADAQNSDTQAPASQSANLEAAQSATTQTDGATAPTSQSAATQTNASSIVLDDNQNLSEQIETLKQAMVNLNRDLFILEEDLLFPSSTQMAVYLSMDVGEYFALDAVEIRIDGEVKTYYLYTDRQVNALYRGGVQRLYVGNVNQGKHTLSAYFVGMGPQNREYKRAVTIEFEKDEDPVAIELNVIDSTNKQQPLFEAKVL